MEEKLKKLHNEMKKKLRENIKDTNEFRRNGYDEYDVELDESWEKGYQEAMNEVAALLGRKPLYLR